MEQANVVPRLNRRVLAHEESEDGGGGGAGGGGVGRYLRFETIDGDQSTYTTPTQMATRLSEGHARSAYRNNTLFAMLGPHAQAAVLAKHAKYLTKKGATSLPYPIFSFLQSSFA